MLRPYSFEQQREYVRGYWQTVKAAHGQGIVNVFRLSSHVGRRAISIPYDPLIEGVPHPDDHAGTREFNPMAIIRVGAIGLFSLNMMPHPRTERPCPTLCTYRYDDAEHGELKSEPLSFNPEEHLRINALSLDMKLLKRCVENFSRTHSNRDLTLGSFGHAEVRVAPYPPGTEQGIYPYVQHVAEPDPPNAVHHLFTAVVLHPDYQPGMA